MPHRPCHDGSYDGNRTSETDADERHLEMRPAHGSYRDRKTAETLLHARQRAGKEQNRAQMLEEEVMIEMHRNAGAGNEAQASCNPARPGKAFRSEKFTHAPGTRQRKRKHGQLERHARPEPHQHEKGCQKQGQLPEIPEGQGPEAVEHEGIPVRNSFRRKQHEGVIARDPQVKRHVDGGRNPGLEEIRQKEREDRQHDLDDRPSCRCVPHTRRQVPKEGENRHPGPRVPNAGFHGVFLAGDQAGRFARPRRTMSFTANEATSSAYFPGPNPAS
ncbi:MAG: hypothetical protein BWY66_01940 [bacterium ADurb.Bin374]|nr:MAG: hypothetical protein BWY66_01940 [bacterium ADurb.Bin374]